MKKISTTIYITHEQNDALKLISDETGIPMAKLIRDGIDMVLESRRRSPKGIIILTDGEQRAGKDPTP